MEYRWKGPVNTYNFCMRHFLLNPIFTRVKVKIKNLLKRNLPTPVGSAERILFLEQADYRATFWLYQSYAVCVFMFKSSLKRYYLNRMCQYR